MSEKIKELVNIIWDYIKSIGANEYGSGIDVRKKDIQETVFNIDGELRISGEEANNFSSFFVNYCEFPRGASAMIGYLDTHGWSAGWYSPGYIGVFKEVKM